MRGAAAACSRRAFGVCVLALAATPASGAPDAAHAAWLAAHPQIRFAPERARRLRFTRPCVEVPAVLAVAATATARSFDALVDRWLGVRAGQACALPWSRGGEVGAAPAAGGALLGTLVWWRQRPLRP